MPFVSYQLRDLGFKFHQGRNCFRDFYSFCAPLASFAMKTPLEENADSKGEDVRKYSYAEAKEMKL